jgi:hypothetical protein
MNPKKWCLRKLRKVDKKTAEPVGRFSRGKVVCFYLSFRLKAFCILAQGKALGNLVRQVFAS